MVENLPPVFSILTTRHSEEAHMCSVDLEPHRHRVFVVPRMVIAETVEHRHARVMVVITIRDHGYVLRAVEYRIERQSEPDKHLLPDELTSLHLDARSRRHEQVSEDGIERCRPQLLLQSLLLAIVLVVTCLRVFPSIGPEPHPDQPRIHIRVLGIRTLQQLVGLIVSPDDREVMLLDRLAGGLLVDRAIVDDEDLHDLSPCKDIVYKPNHSTY